MKLVLIVADVLSERMLAANDCPAISKFETRRIKSSVPFTPVVAEASFMTGKAASQHGVTGLDGTNIIEKLKPFWKKQDRYTYGIEEYGTEIDFDLEENDLHIIRFNGLIKSCLMRGMQCSETQNLIAKLGRLVQKWKNKDIIITSPVGFTRYDARFNIGLMLQNSRQLCTFVDGMPNMETSSAYPAQAGDNDALQFGIFVNRKLLNKAIADRIQGAVTGYIEKVLNLAATTKYRVYPKGYYLHRLPDIIYYANRDVTFPTLGLDRKSSFEPFVQENFSINTLMMSNFNMMACKFRPATIMDLNEFIRCYFLKR